MMTTKLIEGSHDHLESMRCELAEQLKTINALKNEIELLKGIVREEQEAKYLAYVKIADLTKKLDKLDQ